MTPAGRRAAEPPFPDIRRSRHRSAPGVGATRRPRKVNNAVDAAYRTMDIRRRIQGSARVREVSRVAEDPSVAVATAGGENSTIAMSIRAGDLLNRSCSAGWWSVSVG
jgi:hypothetical protein